ncbi:MAG: bifunctional precorrin-2 dehydrogenase/sirohydrochlorin ferrochelatase [Acidobacteria bacterium]|jgi:precorrin-2 dehydrogenase/sirohydrochlorin ferrochelatase|nr:bifunctional precorrin-2 dehydrogenase/sirohydrochlorin ferrochelatase [Acidobacteriota bacterium]
MRYYPAFLDVRGKRCLVVGGGGVAARKARALVAAGAMVRVVAPEISRELRRAAGLECRQARYSARQLRGVWLVVAATDDPLVQQAVWRDAARRGLLCNVADVPARSNFMVPAVVRRGGLQIAVSTGGGSPALARRLRRELEKSVGREYAALLELLRALRPRVMAEVPAPERPRVFSAMVNSAALDLLRAGRRRDARRLLEGFIHHKGTKNTKLTKNTQ